jgi:hypothetical protein
MIESPLLQKMMAQNWHRAIGAVLKGRFGTVPHDVTLLLSEVVNEGKLTKLAEAAGKCSDLDAFRELLLS